MAYTKAELAAAYRSANPGFGNETKPDDEILAKIAKFPNAQDWLSQLGPEPVSKFQQMKDLAASAGALLAQPARAAASVVAGQIKSAAAKPIQTIFPPAEDLNKANEALNVRPWVEKNVSKPIMRAIAPVGGEIKGKNILPEDQDILGRTALETLNELVPMSPAEAAGWIVTPKAMEVGVKGGLLALSKVAPMQALKMVSPIMDLGGVDALFSKIKTATERKTGFKIPDATWAPLQDDMARAILKRKMDVPLEQVAPERQAPPTEPLPPAAALPAPEAAMPTIKPAIAAPEAPIAPAPAAKTLILPAETPLPAAQQEIFLQTQADVLRTVKDRLGLTSRQVIDLVQDKAKDGITLRNVVTRGIAAGKDTKAMADEYGAFVEGVQKTVAAQIPPAAGKYLWDMPAKDLLSAVKAEKGNPAPEWKTKEEIGKDLKKYPEGEAYRLWAAEKEIDARGPHHRLSEEVVKKFKLQSQIDDMIAREVADKAAILKDVQDARGGKQPLRDLVKRMGYINEASLLKHLDIVSGKDWRGREFPEELAGIVKKNGAVSVEDFVNAAHHSDLLEVADPALAFDGLLLEWKMKNYPEAAFNEIIKKRDRAIYGSTYMAKKQPNLDLPGQTFIPGTGPAMPTGKIRPEGFVDEAAFLEGFTDQPDSPGLFSAIEEAEAAGKELTTEVKKAPAGEAASVAPVLDKTEAVFQPITIDKNFKLWRATEMIIQKYALRYGEDKYRPRGAVGVFYPDTKNIFLQAANNVYVAVHEVVHFIDDKTDWFKRLMVVVGRAENRNPIYDPSTKGIRKLLTQFYLETYPGAKAAHPLKKRIKEGAAMLVEMAAERPEMLTAPEWKPLADMILRPGGKFYNKDFHDLERDGLAVMDQYRRLSPNAQIGARKTDKDRAHNEETLFTKWDKFQEVMFDAPHKFLKLDEITGQKNTPASVYNAIQAVKYSGAILNSHFNPKRGLWILLNKGFVKVGERNLGTLLKEIGTLQNADMMDNWLIARRVHAGYQKMEVIRQKILAITGGAYDIENPTPRALVVWLSSAQAKLAPEDYAEIAVNIRSNARDYAEIARIVKNDNIGKDLARKAYEDGLRDFPAAKWAEIHDEIKNACIDMGEDVGMISHERAAQWRSDKTYASFRRDVETLAQDNGIQTSGPSASLSFGKKRVGSELAYEGPLGGLIKNVFEVTKKTMIQRAKNRIYAMTEKNPEILATTFMKDPRGLIRVPNGRGGFDYPQLADKKIIMAMDDGKLKPLIVLDQQLMDVLKLTMLDPQTAGAVEKAVRYIAVTFTRGTTATFVPFSVTNIPRDTVTGFIQSDTKLIPFFDHYKTIMAMARNDGSPRALAVNQYLILTGGRQTLAHMYDGDPTADEMYRRLLGVETKMEKALRWADNFGEIITTPSKVGEDLNRGVEFANSVEQGDDILTSLEKAAQVTDPFSHIGTLGGTLGRNFVRAGSFINPGFQVLHQFAKTALDPKKTTRMTIAMAAYAAMMLAGTYSIRTASKKQRANYKGMQVGLRSGTIWYPLPGRTARDKGRLGKLSVSSNYAVAGNLINLLVQEFMGYDEFSGDEYMQAATAWVPDQFNLAQANRIFFSWLPVAILPTMTVATGVKTFPKSMPLTPKILQGLPRKEQFNDNTSWAGKAIANVLPAALNLNPIEVDYLIEGHLGRTSRFITGRTGMKIFTNPLYSDLYISGTRDLEFYYKLRDAIAEQQNSFQQKLKDAAIAQGRELDVDPDTDVLSLVDAAKKASVIFDGPPPEFLRLIAFKGRVVDIDKKLAYYRYWSRIKNPGPAARKEVDTLSDMILDDINLLKQEYEK